LYREKCVETRKHRFEEKFGGVVRKNKFTVEEPDAPRFSTAIGSNLYTENKVEYFSVFLVAAMSATVPAFVAALST